MPSFPLFQSVISDIGNEKIKKELAELHDKLRELGCSIVMLHDEWHIETPEDKKEQVFKLVEPFLKDRVAQFIREAVSKPLGEIPIESLEGQRWPEVMCACGKTLHYSDDSIRQMVEQMITKQGRCVKMALGARAWMVPRHYIALHGIKGAELPELAKAFKFEEVPP